MAKRLTDTDKWKDEWYSDLTNDYKVVWQWLIDNCNHAGICKRNMKALNRDCNVNLTEDELLHSMSGRVISSNGLWFIPNFLKFQYKNLTSNKPVIVSVRESLIRHGFETMIPQSFGNHYLIIKDKDKSKDKDIVSNTTLHGTKENLQAEAGQESSSTKKVEEGNQSSQTKPVQPIVPLGNGEHWRTIVSTETKQAFIKTLRAKFQHATQDETNQSLLHYPAWYDLKFPDGGTKKNFTSYFQYYVESMKALPQVQSKSLKPYSA